MKRYKVKTENGCLDIKSVPNYTIIDTYQGDELLCLVYEKMDADLICSSLNSCDNPEQAEFIKAAWKADEAARLKYNKEQSLLRKHQSEIQKDVEYKKEQEHQKICNEARKDKWVPRVGQRFRYNNTHNTKDKLNGGLYTCVEVEHNHPKGPLYMVGFNTQLVRRVANITYCQEVV